MPIPPELLPDPAGLFTETPISLAALKCPSAAKSPDQVMNISGGHPHGSRSRPLTKIVATATGPAKWSRSARMDFCRLLGEDLMPTPSAYGARSQPRPGQSRQDSAGPQQRSGGFLVTMAGTKPQRSHDPLPVTPDCERLRPPRANPGPLAGSTEIPSARCAATRLAARSTCSWAGAAPEEQSAKPTAHDARHNERVRIAADANEGCGHNSSS